LIACSSYKISWKYVWQSFVSNEEGWGWILSYSGGGCNAR
jgi:hypothetical protein